MNSSTSEIGFPASVRPDPHGNVVGNAPADYAGSFWNRTQFHTALQVTTVTAAIEAGKTMTLTLAWKTSPTGQAVDETIFLPSRVYRVNSDATAIEVVPDGAGDYKVDIVGDGNPQTVGIRADYNFTMFQSRDLSRDLKATVSPSFSAGTTAASTATFASTWVFGPSDTGNLSP